MTIIRNEINKKINAIYLEGRNQIIDSIINKDNPQEEEINLINAYRSSQILLDSYVTLDFDHIRDIKGILSKIQDYTSDRTQRRPLNFLMFAGPGSGKSHLIKCIAKKLKYKNVGTVTYNMATFQNGEDFIHPVEAVRNLKIQDKLAILFLDEFDSDEKNYAFLLPLLWDGEIQLTHRDLNIGKIVIILAASKKEVRDAINEAKKMRNDSSSFTSSSKLTDLVSRINGGIFEIPDLDLKKGRVDRRIDKICVSISLLEQRFGEKLMLVPWSLLKFIALTEFRYSIRSITQLIDLIPYPTKINNTISMNDLKLPLNSVSKLKKSNMSFHILTKSEQIDSIVERWNNLKNITTLVRISDDDKLGF